MLFRYIIIHIRRPEQQEPQPPKPELKHGKHTLQQPSHPDPLLPRDFITIYNIKREPLEEWRVGVSSKPS